MNERRRFAMYVHNEWWVYGISGYLQIYPPKDVSIGDGFELGEGVLVKKPKDRKYKGTVVIIEEIGQMPARREGTLWRIVE